MSETMPFTEAGTFTVGCNYWASHAGTNMWRDWQPDTVAADMQQLSREAGLQVLRVFPLWPDFQPLACLKGCSGSRVEMRVGEDPLPHGDLGQAGISALMMGRFAVLLDEAERNGLTVIVSLITGWMSGRLFVPPAFENLNVLTDPFVIMWEQKFVKAFVNHFKGHRAVAAWELGNECNCMGKLTGREEAYLWASAIGNAVKAADPTRPLISGMHGIQVDPVGPWTIEDQGELCDVLTTHPYPLFTPYCDIDPIDTMRNGLHATAESRLYGDLGGRPCMVEEAGTLGPMVSSEEVAANYVRMSLMSSLANDCRSFIWWCAYDQDHLRHAPYDWSSIERELGLFRKGREAKPLVAAFKEFGAFNKLVPKLPVRTTETVCLLTPGLADSWGVAYAAFILAKQSGFDLEFQKAGQKLKDAPLYLLPSLSGYSSLTKAQWEELIEKVRAGASLYISSNDALLSSFEALAGLRVIRKSARQGAAKFQLDFTGDVGFSCAATQHFEIEAAGANVLGREPDGNPCFSAFPCGRGVVYYSSIPIEASLISTPGIFHSMDAAPFWRIYQHVAKAAMAGRALLKDEPWIGITEHHESATQRIAFLINYSPEERQCAISSPNGWRLSEVLWGGKVKAEGTSLALRIPANSSAVIRLSAGS